MRTRYSLRSFSTPLQLIRNRMFSLPSLTLPMNRKLLMAHDDVFVDTSTRRRDGWMHIFVTRVSERPCVESKGSEKTTSPVSASRMLKASLPGFW